MRQPGSVTTRCAALSGGQISADIGIGFGLRIGLHAQFCIDKMKLIQSVAQ